MDSENESMRSLMVGMAVGLITKRFGHLNPNMLDEVIGMDNLTKVIYDGFMIGLRTGCELADRKDVYDDVYNKILESGRTEE